MKQKLLLVSAAMLLSSMGAFAAAPGWQKPAAPEGSDPVSGQKYYIMNNQAEQYLNAGKVWYSWATSSALATEGQLSTLDELEGGVWTIKRSDGKFTFISDAIAKGEEGWGRMHVDGASATKWVFTKVANGYQISVDPTDGAFGGDAYKSPLCWGWQGPDAEFPNAVRANLDPTVEGNYCVWSFVAETDYAGYIDNKKAYESSLKLDEAIKALKAASDAVNLVNEESVLANADGDKTAADLNNAIAMVDAKSLLAAAIKDAKTDYPTIDLSAEEAALADAAKSLEDIQKAITDVDAKKKEAIIAAATASASADNPIDMTDMITNPSFETGNTTGWTYATSGDHGAKANSNDTYHCDNADGDYLFNIWSVGNPVSQKIENLPNGIYELSALVCSDSKVVYLLANDTHKAIAIEKNPNDDTKPLYHMTQGTVVVRVQSGELTIGAVGPSAADGESYVTSAYWWYKCDNFQIKYLGDKTESYAYWVENGDDLGVTIYDEETLMTKTVREQYDLLYSALKEADSKDAILAALEELKKNAAEVDANVAAWKSYEDAVASAQSVAGDAKIEGEDKNILADYLDFEAEEILGALELSNEEIAEEIAKVEKMKSDAITNGVTDGSDMTKYLTNPRFDNGKNGWNGSPAVNASCGEKYGVGAFDVYQEIKDAPVGMYEISMQGFYRELRDDDASSDPANLNDKAGAAWSLFYDNDGNPKSPAPDVLAYVYLNDNKTPLKSVYEEKIKVNEVFVTDGKLIGDAKIDPNGEYWYANTMATAAAAFADVNEDGKQRYEVSAFGLVAKKGDAMRIGVKGDLKGGPNWAIFDNFKLTYRAFNAELIAQEFDKAAPAFAVPATTMGKDVRTAAEKVKGDITTVDKNDGKAMFAVLSAIFEANTKMEASINAFKTLSDRIEEFNNEISEYSATAKAEVVAEAMEAVGMLQDLSEYNDEDVAGLISALDDISSKLRIPDGSEASDDEPVDFTSMILSAGFEDKDGNNTAAGWTYTELPNGITGGQKAAKAAEYYEKTYDIHQEIKNLPAGIYMVSVNACYRNGSTEEDFAGVADGTPTLAVMYAATSEDSLSMSVAHMASYAQAEKVGEGAEASVTNEDGETLWIPNDMVSCVAYFNKGLYNNSIIVKVPEDGILRIGMTQKESVSKGWLLMDNWTLTYFGPESLMEIGGVLAIEAVEEAAAASVEVYNVNGVKMAGLQQGINIVRKTDAKGAVKTFKVVVK